MVHKAEDLFNYSKLRYIVDKWDTIDLPDECKRKWSVPNHLSGKEIEVVPLDILKKFLSEKKIFDKNEHIGYVAVSYHHSSVAREEKYNNGRQYVKKAFGLQSINTFIRNTICEDVYDDIDIINCHPTLLSQLCYKKGWDCSALDYYNGNREECLHSMMINSGKSRKDCKRDVIIAMYNNGDVNGYDGLEWFNLYKQNIKSIQSLMATDPEFEEEVKFSKKKNDNRPDDKKNYLGCLCSLIMNYYENVILEEAIKFIQHKGKSCKNLVKMFDGFMYNKGFFTDDILKELEEWVKDKTEWKVEFIIKPMTDIIKLPDDYYYYDDDDDNDTDINDENKDYIVITDDDEGATLLYEKVKDTLKVSSFNYYTKMGNRWCKNTERFNIELSNICREMNFCMQNNKGDIRPYSRLVRGNANIVKFCKDNLYTNMDENFENMIFDSVKGKTCFTNGVYDWNTKEFTGWDENPYVYTTIMMPMPYNPVRDEDKMKEVYNKIIGSCFGEDLAVGNDLLINIASAMSGNPCSKFSMMGMGNRNSGKGVISDLLINTFGGYASTFAINDLKKSTMEESRRTSFLLDARDARILIANEGAEGDEKEDILDGSLLKKCQGGDEIKGRNLFKDAVKFRIQGKLLMFCNDIPTFKPNDAMQYVDVFKFPYEFVNKEKYEKHKKIDENTHYREADPDLKDVYVKDPDVCMAFFHILTDKFDKERVLSNSTIEFNEGVLEDLDNFEVLFKNKFKLSSNEEDYVKSTDIKSWTNGIKSLKGMSPTKIKLIMKNMGFVYHHGKMIGGKRFTGYTHCKMVNEYYEDE